MFGLIRGKIIYKSDTYVLVENNDIGYQVNISSSHIEEVALDSIETFYTHTVVREDSLELYGFFSMAEVEVYRKLLTVSGIGPKVGLHVMALGHPNDIIHFIVTENMEELTKASGIGKKTASRLVLELKDAFSYDYEPTLLSSISSNQDTIDALLSLGYSKEEAIEAMAEIPTGLPVDEALKLALKQMVKNR